MKPIVIYVRRLGGSSDSYRPAHASPVGEGLLRLLGPVPLGESWEFEPGEYVEYEDLEIAPGRHELVAVRSASRDPEFRKRRRLYALCAVPVGVVAAAYWTTSLGLFLPEAYWLACPMGAIPICICISTLGRQSLVCRP